MARVSETFLATYPTMYMQDLKDPLFFVVDMINGFVREGALHDEAIMDIVRPIEAILKEKSGRAIFIADSHPPGTREFQSYPQHCLYGTSESEILGELQPYVEELFRKNSTNTFTSVDFQLFLKQRLSMYQDIVITGCCSDICILQFALCLNAWLNEHNKHDIRIIIPIDCIDTYHIDGMHDAVMNNEFSIRNMEQNGIIIVRHLEGVFVV